MRCECLPGSWGDAHAPTKEEWGVEGVGGDEGVGGG